MARLWTVRTMHRKSYVAKNIVAHNLADRCEIQVSYGIGLSKPLSMFIETFGTEKVEKQKILEIVHALFDLRPASIIKNFGLTTPVFKYEDLASYGHFGRPDVNCPWEYLDKVDAIKKML